MAKKTIQRKTLHSEVIATLRKMIIEGTFKPGEKIPEAWLCQELSISRTPLREALKVLASEGLIELLPNRGSQITRISRKEIAELFPIIGAMEALAGELACRNLRDGDVQTIRRLHDNMVQAFAEGDQVGYWRYNEAIHAEIFRASGNDALRALYVSLNLRIHGVRHSTRKSAEWWQQAVDEHEQMLKALEDRDGPLLSRILKDHLANKAQMILNAMDSEEDILATSFQSISSKPSALSKSRRKLIDS